MKVKFTKYQGTGNDFVLIDNRDRLYDHLDVAFLCHPKFGIGGDGLMLLQNADGYDFEMVYYNSDGNTSSMCGNGGRCIVDFARRLGVFSNSQTHFIAVDGPHDADWSEDWVRLKMQDVASIDQRSENVFVLNTGSPHFVKFVDDVDAIDIVPEARAIRYNDEFKDKGINVNFVQICGDKHIKVRTYERGVENETLSCGTGVTASSIAFGLKQGLIDGKQEINAETPGGKLMVNYLPGQTITDVWLCGPATRVFDGVIDL